MEKINLNLNSIDIKFGIKTVSVKHSVEIFSEEQKKKYTYFQDWLNVESMYHYSDSYFYIDYESAVNWNLKKSKDNKGIEKSVDILTHGMPKSEVLPIYLIKIYNPKTMTFDEVECFPFKYMNELLKVKILIPITL